MNDTSTPREWSNKELALLRNRFFTMRNRAKTTGKTPEWVSFHDWMRSFEAHLEAHAIDFNIDTYRIAYDTKFGYTSEGLRVLEIRQPPSRALFDKLKEELERERQLRLASELTLALQDEDNDDSLEGIVFSATQRELQTTTTGN
jgi:hypothetical protein